MKNKYSVYFIIILSLLILSFQVSPYARRVRPVVSTPVSCQENEIAYNMTSHEFLVCTNTGYVSLTTGGAGSFAPVNATYITQTLNGTLTNEQALSELNSGILKNTNGTGILSIALGGVDYENALTFDSPLSRATNTISCPTCLIENQSITLSGDISGSGTTSITAAIGNNKVTGAMIAMGSDASGDILYYDGADYTRLPKGSDSDVLTLASGLPSWAAASGGGSIGDGNINMTIANSASVGTTAGLFAKLTGAPSTVRNAETSDTENAIGICISNCGTTGNATIAIVGQVDCQFDGSTTAGNYVVTSATSAGKCSDGGSAFPTARAPYGKVLTTNVGAGTYKVALMTPDVAFQNAGNGKSKPGNPANSIQFNVSNTFTGDSALLYNNSTNVITLAQGTKTASSPFIDHSVTWNSAGTTFTNFVSNVTNNSSATGSIFFDWQLNGVSALRLRKDGTNSTALDTADHILAANGSVSRPSYAFTNETNTGWFFTAGSCIIAAVNGASNTCFGRVANTFSQSKPFGFAGATIGNDTSVVGFGFVANGQMEVLATNTTTGGTLFSRAQSSNSGASFTPNLAAGTVRRLTLNSATPTINAASGQVTGIVYTLIIIQDATGNRVPTLNSTYKFIGGAAPTLSTAANAVDIVVFVSDGTNMLEISRALDVK